MYLQSYNIRIEKWLWIKDEPNKIAERMYIWLWYIIHCVRILCMQSHEIICKEYNEIANNNVYFN